jgi:NAD(P)-dependent dehydrogenase (short-subunit alcohol dehydrogenase family)
VYLEKCDLTGKTALVTGGGRGIGLACCRAPAGAGAKMIIADLAPQVAAAGQAEKVAGPAADVYPLDVTKPEQVTACADALNKSGAVDILVGNAGIASSGTGGEDTADEHWLPPRLTNRRNRTTPSAGSSAIR